MPNTATIDDRFSSHQTVQSEGGFFKALAKGAVSFYNGIQEATVGAVQENPYDVLGADVAPNLRFAGDVYVPPSHVRIDPKLTPEALRDFYKQPEVSLGVLAGRTPYLTLAEREPAEQRRTLGKAMNYAFAKRHYK